MNIKHTHLIAAFTFLIGLGLGWAMFFLYSQSQYEEPLIVVDEIEKEVTDEVVAIEPKKVEPPTAQEMISYYWPLQLTYVSDELGFRIKYPKNHIVRTKELTEAEGVGIDFMNVETWQKHGEGINPSVSVFPRTYDMTAQQLYDELTTTQAENRRIREQNCGENYEKGTEEFYLCAYYGGGYIYSLIEFAGEPAVLESFAGEGDPIFYLNIPSKNMRIGGFIFFLDHEEVEKGFTFITSTSS